MSASKYLTQVISTPPKIQLTEIKSPLAKEIYMQLTHCEKVQVIVTKKNFRNPNEIPDYVIHLTGFTTTDKLDAVINNCHQNKSHLVIVMPAENTPSKIKAQNELIKFSKNNSLNFLRISIDPNNSSRESAAAVISKIIYGYTPPPSVIKNSSPPRSLRTLWLLPLIILAPYLLVTFQILMLVILTACTLNNFSNSNLPQAVACSKISTSLTKILFPQITYLPGVKNELKSLGYPPDKTADLIVAYHRNLIQYQSLAAALNQNLLHKTNPPQLPPLLESTSESTAVLQSALRDLYIASPHPPEFLLKIGDQVSSIRSFITQLSLITSDTPKFLPGHKINYLLLIQDNTELRPTGGFLNSFLIISVESGHIVQIQSYSTSDTDKEFTGQINPPSSLQTALNTSRWLLRDSNWDPDFPSSANQIANFVTRELSLPVDCVVAVNTSLFPELLRVLGPLQFSDPQITLTSDNFYNLYLSPNPNSPFLINFIQNLFRSHPNLTVSQTFSLLNLISNQLASRQILISPISFTSAPLINSGWTGSVSPTPCQSTFPCKSDYFYPVESNVGHNKSNYYLSHTSDLTLQLNPGSISTTAKLSVTNPNPKTGVRDSYKNYFRFYLPADTVIDSFSIPQYSLSFDHSLLVIGFLQETLPGQSSDVHLTYHRPLVTNNRLHYQLDLPQEPGSFPYPSQITINYPPSWIVTTYVTSKAVVSPVATAGQLRYNTNTGQISKLDLDILPAP